MRRTPIVLAGPDPLEHDALGALLVAARRLRELDLQLFSRLLAATQAGVAAYDEPDEPEGVWSARMRMLYGTQTRGN